MIQPARVNKVRVSDALITFVLVDGRELSGPTTWSKRLCAATQEQRAHYNIEPDGLIVEWPDIDEHIGVWSLLGIPEDEMLAAADTRGVKA